MNIFLWVLQIALALHTAIGAVWKYSNSAEQTMPSLAAIPNGMWMGLGVLEILCAIALVLPLFSKQFPKAPSIAALIIVAEMIIFCALHMSAEATDKGPMMYWLVVAALAAFVAYGRSVRKPF